MALDPNISLNVKGVQLADPLAQYAQLATIQNAQNQNALSQYQLGSAQRAEAKDINRTNALASAGTNDTAIANALLKSGDLKGYSDFVKSRRETEKATLDLNTGRLDFFNKLKRDLSANPSDENVISFGQDAVLQGLYPREQVDRTVADILKLPPANRAAALSRSGATASDLKPTVTNQTLGGSVRAISTPSFGGAATVVPGSSAATTMTPFQEQDIKIKQGQLNIAQQRLSAEAATGVLSPDSQELAANLYLTTGTLPPMGIGKGGAALKASIMNRAAEISKAGGATPAAGAANIVAAKQDVGAQTKALKDFSTGVQGQMVTSFNTAIDHLGTMDKLVDALNNGDIKAFNSLGNAVARQTGAPAPTNFDTARHIVGAEIQKAIIRAGGTGKEREEAANAFASAGSPAQLKGVIDTYKQLLGGQLNSLEMQYTANTGRKDFNKKLSPTAQETVRKLRGESGAVAPAAGGLSPAEQAELDQLRKRFGGK